MRIEVQQGLLQSERFSMHVLMYLVFSTHVYGTLSWDNSPPNHDISLIKSLTWKSDESLIKIKLT